MLLNNTFEEIHFRKIILNFYLKHAEFNHNRIMYTVHTHTMNNNNQYLEIRIQMPKLVDIKHTPYKENHQIYH
jgi:hypothetical protein